MSVFHSLCKMEQKEMIVDKSSFNLKMWIFRSVILVLIQNLDPYLLHQNKTTLCKIANEAPPGQCHSQDNMSKLIENKANRDLCDES